MTALTNVDSSKVLLGSQDALLSFVALQKFSAAAIDFNYE